MGSRRRVSNQYHLLFDGVTKFHPSLESPFEWTHSGYSVIAEEQRRTGAGGFVRSGAVKHDIAVARNLILAFFKLLRIDVDGAGDDCSVLCKFNGMT